MFTPLEDRLNTLSHAAAILPGAAAVVWLMALPGAARYGLWAVLGLLLYAFGMLGSYTCSALYHGAKTGTRRRNILRRLDHAAIYWHIAGSYSPILLTAMRTEGAWGWAFFTFIWACAAAGTAVSLRRLAEHSYIETACYVLMGLSILAAFPTLADATSLAVCLWIAAEGAMYITGAAFFSLRRPYMHAVFHLFVLLGSACHITALACLLS